MVMQGVIKTKRAYADEEDADGFRILVDRLWPRGVKKERLQCPLWAKEISPSKELRKEFHGSGDFSGFQQAYVMELDQNPATEDFIVLCRQKLQEGNVTLIYASKEEEYNNASVLKQWLTKKLH